LIPEIDIWQAAQLMLKRYDDNSLEESVARANELALAAHDDGAAKAPLLRARARHFICAMGGLSAASLRRNAPQPSILAKSCAE
jgi:hypothetical protein